MGDAEQMWVTVVPAIEDGEEDGAELVVIGIDPGSDDPAQRVVDILMNRGHEGEEGVFYMLPFDLGVRYERLDGRLGVLLLASPVVFDDMVQKHGRDLAESSAALRAAPLVEGGVLLLRRELPTDFDPATEYGDQPVVVLAQSGPAAEASLFASFEEGEASLAVVGPWGEGE
jgi:hypothetical protein